MVADWDIVAQDYFRQPKDSKASQRLPTDHKRDLNASVPKTCERLYRDFLERRKRRAELENRRKAERLEQLARESAPKYLDRNPTLNAESQRRNLDRRLKEHDSLHKYLIKIKDLDDERNYLMGQAKVVRRVPGQVAVDPNDPLLEELKYLGCPVMNAETLNCLFAFHTREVIRTVITKCKEARELQKHMIAGAEEIRLIELRKMNEELRPKVISVVEATLNIIMTNEGLINTELMNRRASGKLEWCHRPVLSELVFRGITEYVFKHSAKFEELCNDRRQILFETVIMTLQNLIAAIQLDTEMRSMFLTLRIPKLQIRGYRYDLVESMRESAWFRDHVGTTSSLKNNHTINQSIREMVQEVCKELYDVSNDKKDTAPAGSEINSLRDLNRSLITVQQPFTDKSVKAIDL